MPIVSRSNPAIKAIRALGSRKQREETGLFFVEGIRIVGEAINLRVPIELLVVAPDLLRSGYAHGLTLQASENTNVLEVSPDVFQSISTKDGPQGIGAVIRQRWHQLDSIDPAGDFCWLALDRIADPGNLGTIMRTSDAVGASGVILIGTSTDPYDPVALRASMGAIFSQRLVRASFDELVAWRRQHSVFLIGTSDAAVQEYEDVAYPSPFTLLMGSEREGLLREMQEACDVVVSIPMAGRSDSLNLAVATGIVLYEAFNQRRKQTR